MFPHMGHHSPLHYSTGHILRIHTGSYGTVNMGHHSLLSYSTGHIVYVMYLEYIRESTCMRLPNVSPLYSGAKKIGQTYSAAVLWGKVDWTSLFCCSTVFSGAK